MDWSMIGAAQTGNIDVLYELIQKDPYVLERIDHVPFLDTPLHEAASAGHVDFMMEMINLKPSFARKLNQAGFSPMHLALQNNRTQAVLRLLKFDEGLVRVKGRGGLTPLHHVAQNGDVDLLIKFLEVCPEAVEDVTVRDETSWWGGRHEAAQRWEKELLSCADIDGNTVLHIAAIKNSPQVVKVLLGHLRRDHINAKNLKGSTALDIQPDCPLDDRQVDNYKGSVKDLIRKAGGLSGSELPNKSISSIHIKLLRPKLSCFQKFATMAGRGRKGIPLEMRNTFLVVTVLIITATYAASLSPPKKADNSSSMKYHIKYYASLESTDSTAPLPGPPPPPADDQINWSDLIDVSSMFWLYNTLTFWAAIGLTAYLLPSRSISLFLLITLSLFGTCYMLLVAVSTWSWKLQYLVSLQTTIPLSYRALCIINYCLSTSLALLVSYRIARYVFHRFVPKTKMFVLVQIVSFIIFAFILVPAILNTETILKYSDFF
ncbi:ankyrin repeat-containing protein BDA1-like [Gossypium arboreum]|uniref:ankyrin repeat-containing protein BDA1-like n=1 Tax=Gossypium arboreum TaxID=29729 RepID=UPI0022F1D8E1|nr:ankyrin repeat-containing protein BDA1-like [Gossypium arboreum]